MNEQKDFLESLWDREEKSEILNAYLDQAPVVRAIFGGITAFPDATLPRDIEDARSELERAIWDWSVVWYLANHRP
ncbi:MAG TPA: hypothetical protein DD435_10820 [Cyanobacteria bacterium UBA8530]|nr:hypothetical protein [Cyanobacteria bacterium UBA8530]